MPAAVIRVVAFQKFLGLEVELEDEHRLVRPLLMDARVDQGGEFRFFYLLPFGPCRVLIEDTRYSRRAALDEGGLESEIRDYAARRGWRIRAVHKRERGILPIPLDLGRAPVAGVAPRIGMRGGFFHPTTGYSLGAAVRLAHRLASVPRLTPEAVDAALAELRSEQKVAQTFFRWLNRVWLDVLPAKLRPYVIQYFYRLPDSWIEAFYAGRWIGPKAKGERHVHEPA
jgi:lycopene beta-cyclase